MSRYFISVPVGLQGPDTVPCGSSVLQLSVFSFTSSCSSSSSFDSPPLPSPTPLDFLTPLDRGLLPARWGCTPAVLHLGGIE